MLRQSLGATVKYVHHCTALLNIEITATSMGKLQPDSKCTSSDTTALQTNPTKPGIEKAEIMVVPLQPRQNRHAHGRTTSDFPARPLQ